MIHAARHHHDPGEALLRHHGDSDAAPGLVDLAVNVRAGTPPAWLARELAHVDLAVYPDDRRARAAIAASHGRGVDEVLLTAGAAEAFVLISRALRPRHAVVVHPQFTEPEVALRVAGHDVDRLVLSWPFTLDPSLVPEDADLVIIGNPTNPTSVLHPAATLRALIRPGRRLVVDEAFMDAVPDESQSLVGDTELPGLLVVRSLTKTWGLAGLRVGYLLADAATVALLGAAQPKWAVSAPALAAAELCSSSSAQAEASAWAREMVTERVRLEDELNAVPGIAVVPGASGPFLLLRTGQQELWKLLRSKGFAVRRGDSFPGLGTDYIRVAVRDRPTSLAFVGALRELQ